MNRQATRKRGFVLIVTLMTLLAISLMVAGFYSQTADALVSSKLVAGSQVASANARFGLQTGIMQLRMKLVSTAPIINPCPTASPYDYDLSSCIPPNFGTTGVPSPTGYRSGLITNNTGGSNLSGNGLQYQFVVYRPQFDGSTVNLYPPGRWMIRSVGFFGSSLNSPNLISSVMEAEVDVESGNVTTYEKPEGYEP